MKIESEDTLSRGERKRAIAPPVAESDTGATSDTEASDLRLCLWAWTNMDGRIVSQTNDGFWEVQAFADEGLDSLIQMVRVPTGPDNLPELTAPSWPVVRAALKHLRATSNGEVRH